ncbi:MAG: GTP cyclohydrolase I FolE2 [Thermoplasmata archaeon]|nr:MAG: GTP cyclohydrolase I FolE2 [Thermoplasmata archaeon]
MGGAQAFKRGRPIPNVVPRDTDVQAWEPKGRYKLTRVGVTNLVKPVQVRRPEGEVVLQPVIDVFVDLPPGQKGSHMSRNVEVLGEAVDTSVRDPVTSLEDLCLRLARELLVRHEYAGWSQAQAKADYFLEREVGNGRTSLERYRLLARAQARREDPVTVKKLIGVEVVGISACPCSMEGVRQIIAEERPDLADTVEELPMMSHNQRNVATLMLEVPEDVEIEANSMIDLVEAELSAPTKELLKRTDEARLVLQAHSNPKFVEDIVRDILDAVVRQYPHLPDEATVIVRSESKESIHKHNAFAERVTTLGELRM